MWYPNIVYESSTSYELMYLFVLFRSYIHISENTISMYSCFYEYNV